MKRILVVSDSHLHNAILNQIFTHHQDIDTCVHCGDLQDNKDTLKIKNLYLVSGNNDFNMYDNEILTTFENKKIWITHSHMYEIETTKSILEKVAKKRQANIVLFGHTHNPEFYTKDNITYLNPGSVAFPRGGKVFIPTYAILEIGEDIQCHFYSAKTHEDVTDIVLGLKKPPKKSFFSWFKKG